MSLTVITTGPTCTACPADTVWPANESGSAANSSRTYTKPRNGALPDTVHLCCQRLLVHIAGRCPHAFQQVIADSQSVGDNRESGIYRCARWEEAAIDYVEVVEVVGLAIEIE